MATLPTRLTRALDLRHPVVSAPMAFAGGGALAAAVSRAGGLGLIGGGHGDGRADALERNIGVEGPRYRRAFEEGDAENTGVWFGEAAGPVRAIEPAGSIVERMAREAAACLGALAP